MCCWPYHGRFAVPPEVTELQAETAEATQIVSGRSSRFAAMQMDLGNLISILLPPLPLLWFGGSMLIYALHRHHPNPRVNTSSVRPTAFTPLWVRLSRSAPFSLAAALRPG